jgi:hypothetical protein
LGGNEFIEIGGGNLTALALLAVADGDVFQRARLHVAVERLDATAELRCGFVRGHESVRRRGARLALEAGCVI